MTPEEWNRLQDLLQQAQALSLEERQAFVDQACLDNATLGAELRSLLAVSDDTSDTLLLPAPWFQVLSTQETQKFNPGDQVAGRYRIHALLGRGGMGEVYESWDEELSIPVALKTLHLTIDTEEARRQLQLEGLLARMVWHPNVCRLYDLGCHGAGEGAIWFLTMELLRGRTLAEVLKAEGGLDLDRAQSLAEQMAAGLGAAHQSGVVHRDFKPANVILVNRELGEQAMVTDFGIARSESTATDPWGSDSEGGSVAGTPAYMAPEQLRGEAAGPAADIYALGVVLFLMVTGRLPFADRAQTEAVARRLREDAPSPRKFRPELNDHWVRAIGRCLERDPAKRFQRVDDLVETLAGRAPAITSSGLSPETRGSFTLPAERDAFVGRQVELDELARNLSRSALVTLVGAGGMGKTRLAIRCGRQTLHTWPGGVWFCDLTEARDETALVMIVARALGVELRPSDPIAQIGHALAARGPCLVILDNFEQLLPQGVAVVRRWLARAAETKFLVTSRQRLALDDHEVVQQAESLSPEAGLELFQTRSSWIRPGFQCTGSDADAAREIVRLVDGMPLAIELAAGRIRVMSTAQIVQEMRRRFSLLTGGGSERHATLAGAIEGSWELLSECEQSAWAQFSVFEGGFNLEAAEAVFAFDQAKGAPGVAEILQSLVEKSLVRSSVEQSVDHGGSQRIRFGMLGSLQEYARIKLRERADDGAPPRVDAENGALRRHGEHFARVAVAARSWRSLEPDRENFVQACRRALERGDDPTAVATFRACHTVISPRGPHSILVDLGRAVLPAAGPGEAERCWVLKALAAAETSAAQLAASVAHYEEALALHREAGDRLGECDVLGRVALPLNLLGRHEEARLSAESSIAMSREINAAEQECVALGFLSEVKYGEGRVEEARQDLELALAIARRRGDRAREAANLINLGCLHFDDGRLEEAQGCFEVAIEIERETGGRLAQGVALGNLALLLQDRGQLDEALGRFEEALAIHREGGFRRYEGSVLADLGNLQRERGDNERARACLEAALSIHRETGIRALEGRAISDLGRIDLETGQPDAAEPRIETALAIARDTEDRLLEATALGRMGALYRVKGRFDDARSAFAESEAMLRPLGELHELSRLLCMRAELELESGNLSAAVAFFREAAPLVARTGSAPNTEIGQMVAALREKLDPVDEPDRT